MKKRGDSQYTTKSKKGTILVENVIFLVLNLIFLTILVIFIFSKTGDSEMIEEKYAKQIALILDSAEPGMTIKLNMEDAISIAEKKQMEINSIVTLSENIITVKLEKEEKGYSYSFFNEIDTTPYPDKNQDGSYNGFYVFVINEKEHNKEK